ncbi:hypothetical protein GCM10023144_33860 [Pigmentiphaga soli]|uniref:UPF0102 protein GCM10023144_33860 n=1 Tax=Pigmentiphaga soli TaxID=1007095 RepID=A0ABP8HD74_9BURK
MACRHLQAAGLSLLARNFQCRGGEIDLIMRHGGVLVFVEVRSRGGKRHGGAAASIDAAKRRRLQLAAQRFLQTAWRGPVPPCRFDVVAIDAGMPLWIRDAFENDAS